MKIYLSFITGCIFLSLVGASQAALPDKVSKLDNWHGLRIVYGKRGADTCDIVFPDSFGYQNRDQLQSILELIRADTETIKDLKCMAPPIYYGLDQLLHLATKKQDQMAAHIILRPEFYGGLNLDGELSEGHTLDRKLPVMIEFKGIKQLLTIDQKLGNDTIDEIEHDLCSEWGYDRIKIRSTYEGLKNNGLSDMAAIFKKKCDTDVASNPDIQRMLKNK